MGDIILDHVNKGCRMGEVTAHATRQISFHVEKGGTYTILGPSNTGKTTVLNFLGGMKIATSRKILFSGKDTIAMNDLELTGYRRRKIDFAFRFYDLIPNLTAAENVELTRQVCKPSLEPEEALHIVSLKGRIHDLPAQLSGEEQQRVAITKTICKNPDLLLCDKPTSALDTGAGKTTLKVLPNISQNMEKTVIIITHNSLVAPIVNRLIEVKNDMVIKESI